MDKKAKTLKAKVLVMNGSTEKYAGKRKYSHMKIMRILLEKIKVKDIKRIGNKYSKTLLSNGNTGFITVSTFIPYYGSWRQGRKTSIGDDVHLWTDGDYQSGNYFDFSGYTDNTTIPKCYINIFIEPKGAPTGGKGKTKYDNLCFYRCIKHSLAEKAKDLKSGKKFMTRFKLTIDDPIDISLIPAIEKTTGISINVIGDHTYTSTYNADKRVLLNLSNGHYTLIKNKNFKLLFSQHERKPIIVSIINKKYIGYDGKEFFDVKVNTYYKERNNIKSENIYIWLKLTNKKQEDYETHFIAEYNDFVTSAEALKEQTKGYINLYKTGSYKRTALKLLADATGNQNFIFEPLEYEENEWHIKCPRGGKIYRNYDDVTYDKLYGYDFCSAYPHIMTKNNTIPYKAGEFKTITNADYEDKYFSKGIYRAIVQPDNMLFTYSKHNYYCDVDINNAKRMGLKVDIIEDGEPNYLCYSADKCIKLSVLFKKTILTLFEMKQKKINGAKQILCIIYGMLGQRYKVNKLIKYELTDTVINFDIPKNCVIDDIKQLTDTYCKIKYKQIDNLYEGPLPRAIVWITALCREMIYNTIGDNMKHVKMILTDGIYTDEPIFDKISVLPKDKQLGDLVKEGYYKDIKIIKGQTHKNYEFVKY